MRRLAALVGLAALLTLLAGRLIPAVAGPTDPRGRDGVVNVYDASDMPDTMITAAERWTASGANVDDPRRRPTSEDADVVVRIDDRRLLKLCGRDCLGYSTSIGRPSDGAQRDPAALEPRPARRGRCRSGSPRTSSGTCSACTTATATTAR